MFAVTLVHGTFARRAEWADPRSQFAIRLVTSLQSPVEVRSFEWSGANSHRARHDAAEKLASQLREHITAAPAARQVVIAHSHGGNVAIYALQHLGLDADRVSLVCLATPFLLCESRLDTKYVEHLVTVVMRFGAVMALCTAFFAVALGAMLLEWWAGFPLVILGTIALCSLLARVLAPDATAVERLRRIASDHAKRLTAHTSPRATILALRPQRDEAAYYLRVLSGIVSLPLMLTTDGILALLGATGALIYLGVFLASAGRTGDTNLRGMLLLGAIIVVPLAMLVRRVVKTVVAAMFCGVALILSTVITSTPAGFGWQWPIIDLFVRTRVGRVPPGVTGAVEREIRVEGRGLRHSMIHSSTNAVDEIARWLRGVS